MMRSRQRPLMRLYRQEPQAARIHDGACTVGGAFERNDPIHGELKIGTSNPLTAPVCIHSAVGGDHDGPNPGDYLTAALVGCFDTTLRIIADRFGVLLDVLSVSGRAEIDVRGALGVDEDVHVGFQRILLCVEIASEGTPDAHLEMLVAATEQSCVVLQTLKGGVLIEVLVNTGVDPLCVHVS